MSLPATLPAPPEHRLSAAILADIDNVAKIPIVSKMLETVCRTTHMGFAAVARFTEDRWVACSVVDEISFGLVPGGEVKLETTICHEIRQSRKGVAIDHVATDPVYSNHHTPAQYGFQSYISVPIFLQDGSFFGTLCAIDPHPNIVSSPEIVNMFQLFAELIAFHLQAIEELGQSQARLKEERQTAAFREQFIAILGHDLRNPVAAVSNGAEMLLRSNPDTTSARLAKLIKNSAFRMSELIENILDFARGRLGDGIVLNRKNDPAVEPMLRQVIAELSSIWPERTLNVRIAPLPELFVDGGRVGQLFSNLLSNAFRYGLADQPIDVDVSVTGSQFVLSVSNAGEPIPVETLRRLFDPFSRGEARPGQQGLGLGLYIAYAIASAHDGDISVSSDPARTRFTFSMPLVTPVTPLSGIAGR